MAKLTLGTALPSDYVTRAQLIASLESLTPVDGQFCDGTTIVVTGGKIVVGAIAQSAVTGLVAALAGKADLNDWLEGLDALTTEAGLLRRTAAGDIDVRAQGATVADPATSPPADGVIAALSSSANTLQAEFNALRDQCEILRDAVAANRTTIIALRDRLKDTGGLGAIAD